MQMWLFNKNYTIKITLTIVFLKKTLYFWVIEKSVFHVVCMEN